MERNPAERHTCQIDTVTARAVQQQRITMDRDPNFLPGFQRSSDNPSDHSGMFASRNARTRSMVASTFSRARQSTLSISLLGAS